MKDLTKTNGTYVKVLNDNMQNIYDMFNKNVSAGVFKDYIIKLVSKANDTPARNNFVRIINTKRSTTDMLLYITNSVFCGADMGMNRTAKSYK